MTVAVRDGVDVLVALVAGLGVLVEVGKGELFDEETEVTVGVGEM